MYLLGGPYNKDYNVLESILESPYFGNYHIAQLLVSGGRIQLVASKETFDQTFTDSSAALKGLSGERALGVHIA